jgi:hypothetical protein
MKEDLSGEEGYPGRSKGRSRAELGFGNSQKARVSLPSLRSRIKPRIKTNSSSGATPPGPACPPGREKELPPAGGVRGGVMGEDGCGGVPFDGSPVPPEGGPGSSCPPTDATPVSPPENKLTNSALFGLSSADREGDPPATFPGTFWVLSEVSAALFAAIPGFHRGYDSSSPESGTIGPDAGASSDASTGSAGGVGSGWGAGSGAGAESAGGAGPVSTEITESDRSAGSGMGSEAPGLVPTSGVKLPGDAGSPGGDELPDGAEPTGAAGPPGDVFAGDISPMGISPDGAPTTGSVTSPLTTTVYWIAIVRCCCTWVNCSARASLPTKTKAPTDKTSATTRARVLRLRVLAWPVVLCGSPRDKSLSASNH